MMERKNEQGKERRAVTNPHYPLRQAHTQKKQMTQMSALTIAIPTDCPVHLKPHQHLIFISITANCAAVQPLILKAVKI